jgi:hypothetical protein
MASTIALHDMLSHALVQTDLHFVSGHHTI